MDKNKHIREIIEKITSDDYQPEVFDMFRNGDTDKPDEQAIDEALFEIWNNLPLEGNPVRAERNLERVKERTGISQKQTRRYLIRRSLKYAALISIILASSITLYMFRDMGTEDIIAETVPTGMDDQTEKTESYMLLADGSEVWVKEESRIEVAGDRENKLVGEALYKVKREYLKGRRFTVDTEFLSVTVLGTIFKVVALPGADETVIDLYEGVLKVNMPEDTYELTSGKKFVYNNHTGEYDIENIPGLWPKQAGQQVLAFNKREMASVFREIELLYNVSVDYGKYTGAHEAVTIKFSSGVNLESVLYMLSGISGDFDYRITDNKIYIYDR